MGAHSQTDSTCLHSQQRTRALAAWLLANTSPAAVQFRNGLGIAATIVAPTEAVMRRVIGRLFDPEVNPDALEAAMVASRR